MPYSLGIDGGGTKTTCAVGDENSVRATATAGPSNVIRVGEAQARESLHQAIRQACDAAGITPVQVSGACIGAAGAARPEIEGILRGLLSEVLACPVEIVGDMEIALDAAFGSGPGVIVIAGTGSIAYGRDEKGNSARAGGWGFAISDEGSAHWIGRAAITAIVHALDEDKGNDGVKRPALLSGVLEAWKVASFDELVRTANSSPPPDFAALFPAVVASAQKAEQGSELARGVLTRAGRELAEIADQVVARLFPKQSNGSSGATVPMAVAGGVFGHADLVRRVFYNEIRRLDARVALKDGIVDPVDGALRRARAVASRP